MTKRLGYQMEARGTDATGIARLTRGGNYKLLKEAVPARQFFKRHDGIATGSRSVLVHTRAKTTGSEKNNLNNHPIHYGDVLGIHNGWVLNDNALFRKHNWERKGEVDSEAIFAAIAHLGWRAGLEAIEGTAAVAWYDMSQNRLHLARALSQPLWMAETGLGDVVFASTLNAVEEIVDMLPLASGRADTVAFPFDEGQMRTIDLTTGVVDLDIFTPAASCWNNIPPGYTEWRSKGTTSTLQRQGGTTSQYALTEPPTFDLQVDDLVWYMPDGDGYTPMMGVITRIGVLRADVQLFLDTDIILETSLPMDRLELDKNGRAEPEPQQEPLALEAGDIWEADDVDGVSPAMQAAVAFLKAQQEVIADVG